LKNVQAEAEKFEKIMNQTLDRINAIEELRANQKDPLELMNSLVNGISTGSNIWLSSMKKEGTQVSIQGFALDVPAIADLIEKLEKSPPFSKVEINYWEVQPSSIEFDLTCELQGAEILTEPGEVMVGE
jgi:Tfp pilus assembly protein PilN